MTITINQQTITGSELPTGDLYEYRKDAVTGVWTLISGGAGGQIYTQAITPFPPSSFTASPNLSWTLIAYSSSNSYIGPFSGITKIALGVTSGQILVLVPVGTNSSEIYRSVGSTSAQRITGSILPTVFYITRNLSGTSPFNNYSITGLGITYLSAPNLYITRDKPYSSSLTATSWALNVAMCDVVDNSVQSYGVWDSANHVYVLLSKTVGTMAALQIDSTTVTYSQLVIPSGGEIKQFANGYYLCTDGSANLYLYSINNGGELVTQLDPSTYDDSLSLELFELI